MTISASKVAAREAARHSNGEFGNQNFPEPSGLQVVEPEPVLLSLSGRPVTLLESATLTTMFADSWEVPAHKVRGRGSRAVPLPAAVEADRARLQAVDRALAQLVDHDLQDEMFTPRITGSQFVQVLRDEFPHVPERTALEAAMQIGYCAARQRDFLVSHARGGDLCDTFHGDRAVDVTRDEAECGYAAWTDDRDFPTAANGSHFDPAQLKLETHQAGCLWLVTTCQHVYDGDHTESFFRPNQRHDSDSARAPCVYYYSSDYWKNPHRINGSIHT